MSTAKKLKPRVMWAFTSTKGEYLSLSTNKNLNPDHFAEGTKMIRVLVLPLDDVPGLLEKAKDAFRNDKTQLFHVAMSDALAAIGLPVVPKAKKGGAK